MRENNIFEISIIITSYIKGEISADQQAVLDSWLEENESNKLLFESLLKESDFDATISEYDSYDIENAFNKVKAKKTFGNKKLSIRRIFYYAAAIVLPIAVAITLFTRQADDEMNNLPFAKTTIKAGEKKARLILSDGHTVSLAKVLTADTINDGSANIVSHDGKLKYNAEVGTTEMKYNTLVIPKGGEFDIVLADGTRVWLNSESEIKYPVNFSGDIRKVSLKGEAYFKVAHNKQKPFIVETEGVSVKVLGTEFNVRSYIDEDNLATTLVKGSVEIQSRDNSSEKLILKPGYQAVFDKTNVKLSSRKVNVKDYIAWKEGRFVFKSRRLEDVIKELSRWYDVEVFYQNNSVKDKKVTGVLKRYDDFSSFIEMMKITEVANFRIKGKTIIIREK